MSDKGKHFDFDKALSSMYNIHDTNNDSPTLSVRLTEKQWEKLERYCALSNRTKSDVVRCALRRYLP